MTKQHKRTVVRWIKRSLLITGAIGIAFMIVRAMLPQPVAVDAAVATRGPLDVEVREDGQTRVRERFVVSAPIGGVIERISVEPGTRVDLGQTLARIAPPPPALLDARSREETRARLAAAVARERQSATAIARVKSSLEVAIRDAKRSRQLAAQDAVPETEAEHAELAVRITTEELGAAEQVRAAAAAEIHALQAVLAPRAGAATTIEVPSPIRGHVLRVLRESAGPVSAGTPLVEIGDPASLEVVVDLLSRDAERIAPGMVAEIETAGAQPIHGVVTLVEPSAFTRISALGVEEQRVNVIICFEGPPSLGDAFRVDVRIVLWHGDDVLRVPLGALFRDHGKWAVYVLAKSRARLRVVEVGHRGRLDVEIVGGLTAGERVIGHPSDRVQDGAHVEER
jgi:HlyD family secretion protein